jgi:hypothetical protein
MTAKQVMERFGPKAKAEQVGKTLMVTLDQPEATERKRRIEEVRAGGPTEDDCPICLAIREGFKTNPASMVVYDADAVLVFGTGAMGPYASCFPRRKTNQGRPHAN